MRYYTKSVVCDYGVFELSKGGEKLIVICNSLSNAELIAEILNKDLEYKVWKRSGEWIDHSCYKGVNICSNCGIGGNRFYKDFKFCPNCGADMNGGAK